MKNYFPSLLPVSFIFAFYLHNAGELRINALFVPILAGVVLSLIFISLCRRLFKSDTKASIFSTLASVLFFTYGDALSLFSTIPYLSLDLRSWIVFVLWCLMIILFYFVIKKTKRSLLSLQKFLLLSSIAAVIIPGIQIGSYSIVQHIYPQVKSPMKLPQASKTIPRNSFPDIYYIMPEDYSSPEILKKYFSYDSSTFINALKERGFYIADKSTSNYPKTFLSLSSSLNMEYLDYLSSYKNSTDQTVVAPLIENSIVMRFLKHQGYAYYQMGSWWGPASYNRYAKENFILENEHLINFDEFAYTILDSTPISPFLRNFFSRVMVGDSEEDKRNRILYQFKQLPEVARLPSPKFVFAHIIAPHGPYVFSKSCEFKGTQEAEETEVEENYVEQAECVNQKLLEAIDLIIKDSKRPPIIIIQSDEGAPFLNEKLTPYDNWKTADKSLLKEKFPIFTAIYLPGASYDLLYPAITPVNIFRVVLNQYFGTTLPKLQDKNYIFMDMEHLYEFKEVTDSLQ